MRFYGTWLFVLLLTNSVSAQQWTSFQNGGSVGNPNWKLPQKWTPEENIAWQTNLTGYGQSSPVVFGETVFVTTVVGANKESVRVEAFNVADGESKWSYEQTNSKPEKTR